MCLVRVVREDHVAAGMVGSLCEVDAPQILGLVPLVDIADPEGSHGLARRAYQGDFLVHPQRGGKVGGHRQGDRDCPGVELPANLDDGLLKDTNIGCGVHGALEWAQHAVPQAIDAREVRIRDRYLCEVLGFGQENVSLLRGHVAVDGLRHSTMGGNELRHCHLCWVRCGSIAWKTGREYRGTAYGRNRTVPRQRGFARGRQ